MGSTLFSHGKAKKPELTPFFPGRTLFIEVLLHFLGDFTSPSAEARGPGAGNRAVPLFQVFKLKWDKWDTKRGIHKEKEARFSCLFSKTCPIFHRMLDPGD